MVKWGAVTIYDDDTMFMGGFLSGPTLTVVYTLLMARQGYVVDILLTLDIFNKLQILGGELVPGLIWDGKISAIAVSY